MFGLITSKLNDKQLKTMLAIISVISIPLLVKISTIVFEIGTHLGTFIRKLVAITSC